MHFHFKKSAVAFLMTMATLLSVQSATASVQDNLFEAVSAGDLDQVKHRIADGADVNAVNPYHYNDTLLMYAVRYYKCNVSQQAPIQFAMAKFLISANANVNAVNSPGWTALSYAAQFSEIDTVKLLMTSSANSNLDRGAALLISALRTNSRPEIVAELVASGVHLNPTDLNRETPLKIASHLGKLDLVTLLLRADPNLADSLGRTALHEAAMNDTRIDFRPAHTSKS